MKAQISGFIKFESHYDNDGDSRIVILRTDGVEIDLVDEVESFISVNGNQLKLSYWLSDKPCTKNEMVEGFLNSFYGSTIAEYESESNASWTYGATSRDSYWDEGSLVVGGHDLFSELSEKDGKFLIMEIDSEK